jgi:hypothetical protein
LLADIIDKLGDGFAYELGDKIREVAEQVPRS